MDDLKKLNWPKIRCTIFEFFLGVALKRLSTCVATSEYDFFLFRSLTVSRAKKETILQVNRLTKIGVVTIVQLTAIFRHKK